MPPPIRILVVEDDRGTRAALVQLVGHASEMVCLGAFKTAEEAEREIPRLSPDVVLMDIDQCGGSGTGFLSRVKSAHPNLKLLMLATYDDSSLIFESLRAGANGYLLKRCVGAHLLAAIEEGHRGGSPMSMQIARKVASYFHQLGPREETEQLTEIEAGILRLLIKGLTRRHLAEQLALSESAIGAHLGAIYRKLHVAARGESAGGSDRTERSIFRGRKIADDMQIGPSTEGENRTQNLPPMNQRRRD